MGVLNEKCVKSNRIYISDIKIYILQLYNYSNKISNKLINAQTTFWLANASSIVVYYNIKNIVFMYYNILLSAGCFYLYINSSYTLINTIKYI